MPKYSKGVEPVAYYIGEEPVIRKYHGAVLIWDGTRSAVAQAVRAHATATARNATGSASSSATALTATGNATAHGATATASANATATAATAMATIHAPTVTADATATATVATATATVHDATGSETFNAIANAIAATATAEVHDAVPHADAHADATAATAATIVYDAVGQGSAVSTATAATATALVHDATPSASASAGALVATGSASANNATPHADASATAIAATATAEAKNATGTAVNFLPSGMYKNASTQGLTTSYAQITGWTADTGTYPGSTISSNGIVAQGSKSGGQIEARVPFTSSLSATVTARIKRGTTVIATGTGVSGTSGTATCVISGQTITSGEVYTVEVTASNNFGSVNAGTGTWLRIT